VSEVSCSDGSLAAGEQLMGSAPEATAWVALEQSGPWGARAFTSSHLDPDLGRSIERAAAAHGVRPSLIRCPGRHADEHTDADARHVLVAHTHPRHPWLLEGTLAHPGDLLALDWAALAAGDLEAVRRSLPTLGRSARVHLLVCTNAKRDACCAVKGRPVVLGVATAHPGQVWEVTHTSGHRFAPTAVLLPAGTLHGRLDVASANRLLRAAERGATVLEGSRGRSTWPGPAQAAELAVREEHGILGLHDLEVVEHTATGEHSWRTVVDHADGRSWQVFTDSRACDVHRAESCGKAFAPLRYFTRLVEEAAARGPSTIR
jgi:hypothetical protein